jgi:hypothetical protein
VPCLVGIILCSSESLVTVTQENKDADASAIEGLSSPFLDPNPTISLCQ